MVQSSTDILKKYWGHDCFRPGQQAIVDSIISNVDTLALLPTGGGKSICFQIPALYLGGLTLVVSPLIALMKDQVENLVSRNIKAAALHSGHTKEESHAIIENALKGYYAILYVSPERLQTENFRGYLPNLNINRLIIDEAHCISMWGNDFRPAYIKLGELREFLPGVSFAAFTASAPQWIQDDIVQGLGLSDTKIFKGDFSRENLIFHNIETEDKDGTLLNLTSRSKGSSLVFANTRKSVEDIARLLVESGESATYYHAGLSNIERSNRQSAWIANKFRIMVCTNAFGMGVDKPDVRWVIHTFPPKNPEDYYQEAGRAGRDGKSSHCVLLHQPYDWRLIARGLEQQHPSIVSLTKTYHTVLNHLGVSDGQGELQSFAVDLNAISQLTGIPMMELFYGAKALEVVGQWQFSENEWTPSKVKFTAGYEEVYELKQSKKQYELLLDILLRSHGGIFDHPIIINEEQLAKRLRSGAEQLRNNLLALHRQGILHYKPQTQLPSITLSESRSLYPTIKIEVIQRLFDRRKASLKKIIQYVTAEECRSVFWQKYFGNTEDSNFKAAKSKQLIKICGTCDYCRGRKDVIKVWNDESRRQWWQATLAAGPKNSRALLKTIPPLKKSDLTNALRDLIDEGCIIETENGSWKWVNISS